MSTTETGPYCFALVEETDTTFLEAFARVDLWVYSCDIEQQEGENATATLEIDNPGAGLLASGQLQWMWISKKVEGVVTPLFFGQLSAVPDDLFGQIIKIVLVARAPNQDSQKRALAQTLKVPPYNEIWVEGSRQSDPDVILDFYSSRWAFDRMTLQVSVSDVLEGEDGVITFTADDLFYDGRSWGIDGVPLTSISASASVSWTQRAIGTILLPTQIILSYTGDGLISDWIKPFAELGSGWTAGYCTAVDILNVAKIQTTSGGFHIRFKRAKPKDGDLMTADESWTKPASNAPMKHFILSEQKVVTIGYLPTQFVTQLGYGQESYIDYPGSQPSASVQISDTYVPQWKVGLYGELRYSTERQRRETINFTLEADLQPVMSPAGKPRAEIDNLKLNSRDVGAPLEVRAFVVASGNVSNGDEFSIAGLIAPYLFQSTLTSGVGHVHIGATAAITLQNFVNAINVNGDGVAGVDFSNQNESSQIVVASVVDSTTILLRAIASDQKVPVETTSSVLSIEAPSTFIVTGTAGVGTTITVCGIIYTFDTELALHLDELTLMQHIIVQTPYHILLGIDGEGSLVNLDAAVNASGGAGSAYTLGTIQNPNAISYEVNDAVIITARHANSTVTVSATGGLTVSKATSILVPDQTTVPIASESDRTFFPSDSGLLALESVIAQARAKLRFRSRVSKAGGMVMYDMGIDLSCRKNVIMVDSGFPGGAITGKVIQYLLRIDGDSGDEFCTFKIGSCVGKDTVIVAVDGDPTYVDDDYGDPGYQERIFTTIQAPSDDLNYSPPIDAPDDDGLIFPLTSERAIISDRIIGDYVSQEDALNLAWDTGHPEPGNMNDVAQVQTNAVQGQITTLLKHHVMRELILRPLNNGPFNDRYDVDMSVLSLPKQLDLGAT